METTSPRQLPHPKGLDQGADYVLTLLANYFNLPQYERIDGFESWEGDVDATLYGMLTPSRCD